MPINDISINIGKYSLLHITVNRNTGLKFGINKIKEWYNTFIISVFSNLSHTWFQICPYIKVRKTKKYVSIEIIRSSNAVQNKMTYLKVEEFLRYLNWNWKVCNAWEEPRPMDTSRKRWKLVVNVHCLERHVHVWRYISERLNTNKKN